VLLMLALADFYAIMLGEFKLSLVFVICPPIYDSRVRKAKTSVGRRLDGCLYSESKAGIR